jgi:TolB-like protein/Tfp pilus assembly protein PilF
MTLIAELKRRNVLRVGAAYVALAWLVVQVLDSLAPLFGLSDAVARLIVIAMAIGLVPVLVVSWLFELTPDGFRREQDIDHASPAHLDAARRLDRIIIAVLGIAVVYFAVDKFVFDPARDAALATEAAAAARDEALLNSFGDRSIAVLPFIDASADGDHEYISDGIAEEIINLLATVRDIRVISRSSSFVFRQRDVSLTEVAERLDVRYIMEGSVRRAGNRLRITAQMIDPRTGTALWSENFDREFGDIFAIQDEIASEVVGQLEVELAGNKPTSERVEPEAYALYLRARNLVNKQTRSTTLEAEKLLNESLAIDPRHAAAWNLYVSIYSQLAFFEGWSMPELALKVRDAVENALEVDPANTQAKAHLARLSYEAMSTWPGEAQAVAYAMSLEPGDPAFNADVSTFLRGLGRSEKAVQYAEYAALRDPMNASYQRTLMLSHFSAGNFDDALEANRRMREITGGHGGLWYQGMIHLLAGDSTAALAAFDEWAAGIGEDNRYAIHGRTLVHLARGEQAGFEQGFEQLRRLDDNEWLVAMVYTLAGKPDEAIQTIDSMIDPPRNFGPPDMNSSPIFSRLSDHPRWEELLRRRGTHPEQIAAIPVDEYFPGPGLPPTVPVEAP